jgi:hypothetical protein
MIYSKLKQLEEAEEIFGLTRKSTTLFNKISVKKIGVRIHLS